MLTSNTQFRAAVADAVYQALGITRPSSAFISERVQDVLLRVDQVASLTGLSRASIYREIKLGRFPAPYRVAENISCWRLTEIEAWMADLKRAA